MVLEMGEKNDILPHDKNDVQDNTSCVIDPQAPNLDNNVKLEFDIVRHRVFPQAHNFDKDVQLEFDTMTLHIDPQVKTLVDSLVSEVIEAENEVEKEEKKTKRKRKVFITNIFQDEDPAEIAIAYSFEEMNRVFEEYKTRTGIDFSTVGKAFHSGRPKIDISKPLKIRWYQNEKKFACHTPSWRGDSEINGVPYLYCGKSPSSCEFGKNPKKTKSDGSKKIRKKFGCPALLNVRKITMFPQFKLDDIDQCDSKTLSSLTDVLRESLLAEDKELRRKVVYVLSFPKDSTHRFHNPSEQATSNNLDKQIILKIQDMVLQDFTTTQINQQFIVGELFYGQTLPEKTDKRYYPGAHQVGNNRKIIHLFYTMTKDDIANLNGQFTVMRENGDKVIFEIDTPPDRSKITSYVRMKDRVAAGNVNKELEHFSDKQEQGTTISAELKHTSKTSGRNEQVHKRDVTESFQDDQCPKVVQCVNSEVQETELNILKNSEVKKEKFDKANTCPLCSPESLQSEDSKLPDAQMSISNESEAMEATSTLTSSQKVRKRSTPCNDNNKQSDLNTSKEIFVGLDEKNSARITTKNRTGMVESTTHGHENEKNERNVITSQSSFQQGEVQNRKDSAANKPKKDSLRIQKFYLFHQTVKQQYLLNRYGEIVFILEIKPKQCGFRAIAVSLFIICVRTNVDYQVVGTILCNKYNDHVKVLTEALTEFKEINSSWKPKYLIIHPSETMVSVVHHLFAGVEYYFNKDSCLQEWEEYLTNQKNGLKEHSTKLLRDLETLQSSSSMDEFKQNANQLSRCPIWKSESTSTFRQNWFAGSKRWVACRLPRNLLVLLKDEWLKSIIGCYEGAVILSTSRSSKEGGIVHLIERLTVTLVKDRFESYILKNKTYLTNNVLVAKQNPSLMTDLGIPLNMTSHCAHIINPMNEIQPQIKKIKQINYNQFEVTTRKTHTNTTHIVTVAGNQAAFPSCSCAEWKNNAILCQHMFMVIQSFKFQFDWLSPLYRESPFFQIDQISINSDLAESTSMGLQDMLSEPVQGPTTLVSTVLAPANNVKSSSSHSSKTQSGGEKSGFQMKIDVQSSVDRVTARTINLVSLKDGNATPVVDEINCLEKAHTKDEPTNLNERSDLGKEDSGFDDTIPTIPMMIEPQRSSRQDVLEQSNRVNIVADSVKTNSQHVANIKENLLKDLLNTINFSPSNVNKNSRLPKDLAKADSKTKGVQIIEEPTPAVTKGTSTLPPRRSIFKKNLQMNSRDIIVFKRFIACMEELCYFDENFIAQVKEEFQREIRRTDSESVILQTQNDYNTVEGSLATEFRNNDITMATDNNELMPIIIDCKSLANQNGVNNVTLADDITLNFTGAETSSLNNAKKEDPRSVLGNFAKLGQSVFPDSSRQQSDRTNRKQKSIQFRCNNKSDQPLSLLYQNQNLTINFPPNTRPSKNNFSTNAALTKPIDSLESIQKQSIKSASTANLLSKNETSQLCDNLTRASVVASKTATNVEKTSAATHTMKSPIIESNDNESCRIVTPTKKRSFKFRKLNKQQKTTSPLASKKRKYASEKVLNTSSVRKKSRVGELPIPDNRDQVEVIKKREYTFQKPKEIGINTKTEESNLVSSANDPNRGSSITVTSIPPNQLSTSTKKSLPKSPGTILTNPKDKAKHKITSSTSTLEQNHHTVVSSSNKVSSKYSIKSSSVLASTLSTRSVEKDIAISSKSAIVNHTKAILTKPLSTSPMFVSASNNIPILPKQTVKEFSTKSVFANGNTPPILPKSLSASTTKEKSKGSNTVTPKRVVASKTKENCSPLSSIIVNSNQYTLSEPVITSISKDGSIASKFLTTKRNTSFSPEALFKGIITDANKEPSVVLQNASNTPTVYMSKQTIDELKTWQSNTSAAPYMQGQLLPLISLGSTKVSLQNDVRGQQSISVTQHQLPFPNKTLFPQPTAVTAASSISPKQAVLMKPKAKRTNTSTLPQPQSSEIQKRRNWNELSSPITIDSKKPSSNQSPTKSKEKKCSKQHQSHSKMPATSRNKNAAQKMGGPNSSSQINQNLKTPIIQSTPDLNQPNMTLKTNHVMFQDPKRPNTIQWLGNQNRKLPLPILPTDYLQYYKLANQTALQTLLELKRKSLAEINANVQNPYALKKPLSNLQPSNKQVKSSSKIDKRPVISPLVQNFLDNRSASFRELAARIYDEDMSNIQISQVKSLERSSTVKRKGNENITSDSIQTSVIVNPPERNITSNQGVIEGSTTDTSDEINADCEKSASRNIQLKQLDSLEKSTAKLQISINESMETSKSSMKNPSANTPQETDPSSKNTSPFDSLNNSLIENTFEESNRKIKEKLLQLEINDIKERIDSIKRKDLQKTIEPKLTEKNSIETHHHPTSSKGKENVNPSIHKKPTIKAIKHKKKKWLDVDAFGKLRKRRKPKPKEPSKENENAIDSLDCKPDNMSVLSRAISASITIPSKDKQILTEESNFQSQASNDSRKDSLSRFLPKNDEQFPSSTRKLTDQLLSQPKQKRKSATNIFDLLNEVNRDEVIQTTQKCHRYNDPIKLLKLQSDEQPEKQNDTPNPCPVFVQPQSLSDSIPIQSIYEGLIPEAEIKTEPIDHDHTHERNLEQANFMKTLDTYLKNMKSSDSFLEQNLEELKSGSPDVQNQSETFQFGENMDNQDLLESETNETWSTSSEMSLTIDEQNRSPSFSYSFNTESKSDNGETPDFPYLPNIKLHDKDTEDAPTFSYLPNNEPDETSNSAASDATLSIEGRHMMTGFDRDFDVKDEPIDVVAL